MAFNLKNNSWILYITISRIRCHYQIGNRPAIETTHAFGRANIISTFWKVFFPLTVLLNWKSRLFFGWTTCLYISGNNCCKLSNVSNKDDRCCCCWWWWIVFLCIIRLCQGDNEFSFSFYRDAKKVSDFNRHFCSPSNTHSTADGRQSPLSTRQQNWGCDVLDCFREIFKWYAK